MQHHDAFHLSRRHHENGGATSASMIDRLLRPMFSLGFSANKSIDESDHFLGLKSRNNVHDQEHDEEEEDEEDEETSETGGYKNLKKKGENPNSSCSKKRENGGTRLCARGHWKPSEDAKLRELVAAFGPQNWNLIAEKLEGRSGKSCRLRWYNQLDPKINKRAFTEEEEERLIEAHRVYGNKWAFISRFFPGRTDNSVKNHWHVLMARRSREKSKSYMKMKWANSKPPPLDQPIRSSVQETAVPNYFNYADQLSNYERQHFNHGNSYSQGSTSQISFAAPISSSTASAADQYQDAAYYMETPTFIDFLGVGSV
ncbi:myb domain protein 105 [Perilla frutescens var. hirtella]|uniref:Myb domain protein 105 n=1 Tax=Perilla frutescens var. hirtella TaxID=608512 RepID=A0AAD4JAZ5_PERFH|nr:myb domain protein 105 [Perilla frutescens var. hirtella]